MRMKKNNLSVEQGVERKEGVIKMNKCEKCKRSEGVIEGAEKMAKYKRGRVREEKWLSRRCEKWLNMREESTQLCEESGKMTKYGE